MASVKTIPIGELTRRYNLLNDDVAGPGAPVYQQPQIDPSLAAKAPRKAQPVETQADFEAASTRTDNELAAANKAVINKLFGLGTATNEGTTGYGNAQQALFEMQKRIGESGSNEQFKTKIGLATGDKADPTFVGTKNLLGGTELDEILAHEDELDFLADEEDDSGAEIPKGVTARGATDTTRVTNVAGLRERNKARSTPPAKNNPNAAPSFEASGAANENTKAPSQIAQI